MHVIITGTGRSGTSFLVKFLTYLGFDTGFKAGDLGHKWNENTRSELETDVGGSSNLPRIIKDPRLSFRLRELVEKEFPIEHVIIPVRPLKEVAKSRQTKRVGWDGREADHGGWVPFLGYALGSAVADCVSLRLPFTLLEYPRLVQDGEYLYEALAWLFKDTNKELFLKVFGELSDYRPQA